MNYYSLNNFKLELKIKLNKKNYNYIKIDLILIMNFATFVHLYWVKFFCGDYQFTTPNNIYISELIYKSL